jgi:hypothetical protein
LSGVPFARFFHEVPMGRKVLLAVLGGHAVSVVLNADPVHAAEIVALQRDDDMPGIGIEGVPEQLLDGADGVP